MNSIPVTVRTLRGNPDPPETDPPRTHHTTPWAATQRDLAPVREAGPRYLHKCTEGLFTVIDTF